MKFKSDFRLIVLTLIILAAAICRLIPHPPNFTPIGGMALFGAAYFSRKYLAFLIPFAILWISDLVLNNFVYTSFAESGFQWFGNVWVYAGFALIVVLGIGLLKRVKFQNLLIATLGASLVFFIITNFGVWMGMSLYPKTAAGLMACYIAAIPFFLNTILGNLLFTGLLFGIFEWMSRKVPQLQKEIG
ncbi:MAG: hypothetical protein GY705_02150 [Bacteroidetes bacterium]|nr:hypothetical protein [Bacteroidota bacterium]